MSMLGISFPSGMTSETEGAVMTNTTGQTLNYGDIVMVDQVNIHATTLKRYKMILPTAAGLLGTTAGEFGVCIEPNGISDTKEGRFVFVADEVEVTFKASENIAIGDLIRPDHANGTAALRVNAINDAGSAVGERFLGRALSVTNVASIALAKVRFNGLNPVAWRTV